MPFPFKYNTAVSQITAIENFGKFCSNIKELLTCKTSQNTDKSKRSKGRMLQHHKIRGLNTYLIKKKVWKFETDCMRKELVSCHSTTLLTASCEFRTITFRMTFTKKADRHNQIKKPFTILGFFFSAYFITMSNFLMLYRSRILA